MYEVVEGIKLEERTCLKCTNTFKVFPSHPQLYCCDICSNQGKKGLRKTEKRKKGLKHKIKESDYE